MKYYLGQNYWRTRLVNVCILPVICKKKIVVVLKQAIGREFSPLLIISGLVLDKIFPEKHFEIGHFFGIRKSK